MDVHKIERHHARFVVSLLFYWNVPLTVDDVLLPFGDVVLPFGDVSVIPCESRPKLVVDLAYFAESSALSGKRLVLFGDDPSSSGDGRIAFDNNHNARWFLAENDSFARRVLKDFP